MRLRAAFQHPLFTLLLSSHAYPYFGTSYGGILCCSPDPNPPSSIPTMLCTFVCTSDGWSALLESRPLSRCLVQCLGDCLFTLRTRTLFSFTFCGATERCPGGNLSPPPTLSYRGYMEAAYPLSCLSTSPSSPFIHHPGTTRRIVHLLVSLAVLLLARVSFDVAVSTSCHLR